MLAIFVGYIFLGRYWRIVYVNYINQESPARFTILLAMMAMAGIWALPMGLGGIIGSLAAIIYTFATTDMYVGSIATVAGIAVIWLGFQETDKEKDTDRRITWQEWLALAVTVISPLAFTVATFRFFTGPVAGMLAGAIAGAITVVGPQIEASELSRRQAWQLFAILAALGLSIGFIYGIFTYRYFAPS
jgi:uncharacterized membrane protein HdeD (DUF308 family)